MCIDYKALNKVTIRKNYPLRRVDDFFDRLVKANYFGHVDLKSRYYQIQIAYENVKKHDISHKV